MTNETAIIVGVGPGLGLALARAFAGAGYPVALIGRSVERLEGYAHDLTGEQPVRAYPADVADRSALRAAITAATDELGAPEVLVYNAALKRADSPTDGDDDGWTTALAVNVLGAKAAAETVLPALRDHGHGSLLFTGGSLSSAPNAAFASMSVGKAALVTYVRTLADEVADDNVRATVVTIDGRINGGEDRLSADALAAGYVELHREDRAEWTPEVLRD